MGTAEIAGPGGVTQKNHENCFVIVNASSRSGADSASNELQDFLRRCFALEWAPARSIPGQAASSKKKS
jgi:hypothetical protein